MTFAKQIWNRVRSCPFDAALFGALALPAFLLAANLAAHAQSTTGEEFVIRNVRVFDGHKVIANAQVWVNGGTIKAVGADVKAPASVRTIDGQGDTLLPGLIDSHTHAYGDALKQALVFGVTTELDMFTDHNYAAQIRSEQAAGKDLDMADLRSAGTLVTAPKGHGTEYGMQIPTISSPAEAQAFVDARIAEGSDYIKIIYDDGKAYGITIPTISKETMAAVITAAHKRGKIAVVHIGTLQGARDAIDAGADGLAHLFIDATPDPAFGSFVASHHAFVVPTLSVLGSISGTGAGKSLGSDPMIAPMLDPATQKNLTASFPRSHGDFAYPQATVQQLKAQRVPILAGTDAPNPGTVHGASLHGELELLVGSGLTPIEALVAATSAPAAAFHLNDRGEIAVGKRADLLLVKGDPTTDIKATRNIVSVWKVGVEDDRAAYRAAIEKEIKAAQEQAKAAPPAGSESGLVSDFDGGNAAAKFGTGWQISTDSIRGGQSKATMNVVDGGAEGSKGALKIEGDVMAGAVAWAGAMFFPGPAPMAPANLSSRKSVSFWTKGDGHTYRVMVYTQSGGFMPKMRTFTAGTDWKKFTFPLSEFETDGHDFTGLFFGVFAEPGTFNLMIDNVRFE